MSRTRPQVGVLGQISGRYSENRVLIWACILIFVNQLGFGSIVPVTPLYAQAFGVSSAAIGLTIAIYGAARFLMNVPTAQIADRFGRRIALAMGGAVTVGGNLVCALADNYWIFLSGRFIAGAGGAMVITGSQIVVSDISVKANRGRLMAVYQGVFGFALGIGPVPGGFLADQFSLSTPFFMYAILGSAVAMLAWTRIPETRGLKETADTARSPSLPLVKQLRILLSHRGFVLVAIVSFTAFFARTGAMFNIIPTLGDNKLNLTASEIGIGLALTNALAVVLAYPSGSLVDRFGRKTVIVPSTIFSGLSLVLFAVSPTYAWFLAACLIWAVGVGIASAAPAAYAVDSAPDNMTASAMGTYRMLADAGYVVGPLLLGGIADIVSAEASLYLTASLVVSAGTAFALLAPETYRRQRVASG